MGLKNSLSIIKKSITQKYWEKLKKLKNDLSDRGLLNTGIGDEEEKKLMQECRNEITTETEKETSKSREQRQILIKDIILSSVALISLLFNFVIFGHNTKTEKQINRPYVSVTERNNLLGYELGNQVLQITLKNTGNLPAELNLNFEGWSCTSTIRNSNNDYIMPGQEIKVEYDLFNCEKLADIICKMYTNIRLVISYKKPGDQWTNYETILKAKYIKSTIKPKILPLTVNSSSTLFGETFTTGCGDGNNKNDAMLLVWYVDKMK